MYRCYLLRNGRIAFGQIIEANSLEDTITASHDLLKQQPPTENFTGIEVWRGADFLYAHGSSWAD